MLRSVFVITVLIVGLWYSLKGPFFALLLYLWLAYFRPESWLWWDFITPLRLSLVIALLLLASVVMSGRQLRLGGTTTLLILFTIQSALSVVFSPVFDYSWAFCQDFIKSMIISVLIVTLVDSESRVRATLSVICLSLGLEATKQGWGNLILHPGATNQNDIPFIGDNNAVAVAMLMLVALMLGLARTATKRWEKYGYRFMAVGTVYRAISTYSRGGFLAAGAFGLHYLLRSKRKVGAVIGLVIVLAIIVPVMPDAFWDRMNTIPRGSDELETADYSSKGRVHFWWVAVEMANQRPLTGVGHNAYNFVYNDYDFSHGQYGRGRSVHSTWFGVLAELGYPGLVLFLMIIFMTFRNCRRTIRLAKQHPEMADLAHYASSIEAAIVTLAVGGSFVILQYTEFLWHTIALSIALDRVVAERAAALAATKMTSEPEPVPVVASVPFTLPARVRPARTV